MWKIPMLGTDLYHITHWFLLYSMMGWLVESIYMSICNRKITNRGFVKGPFCPIYGVGALSVYFILKPFSGNFLALYLMGAFLATTFEYLIARLMIFIFGDVWWDYHEKPFNFKGILCLESTLAWGLYTIGMFGFLHKFISRIVDSYSYSVGRIMGSIVAVIFSLDMLAHIYFEKKESISDSFDEIKERWRRSRT